MQPFLEVFATKTGFNYTFNQMSHKNLREQFYENSFLKLLIGSQPIMEGMSLVCGRRGLK